MATAELLEVRNRLGRFELFDLANDPGQKTDLSTQLPDVFARLKRRLLEINASVMADAPDWLAESAETR